MLRPGDRVRRDEVDMRRQNAEAISRTNRPFDGSDVRDNGAGRKMRGDLARGGRRTLRPGMHKITKVGRRLPPARWSSTTSSAIPSSTTRLRVGGRARAVCNDGLDHAGWRGRARGDRRTDKADANQCPVDQITGVPVMALLAAPPPNPTSSMPSFPQETRRVRRRPGDWLPSLADRPMRSALGSL